MLPFAMEKIQKRRKRTTRRRKKNLKRIQMQLLLVSENANKLVNKIVNFTVAPPLHTHIDTHT